MLPSAASARKSSRKRALQLTPKKFDSSCTNSFEIEHDADLHLQHKRVHLATTTPKRNLDNGHHVVAAAAEDCKRMRTEEEHEYSEINQLLRKLHFERQAAAAGKL